VKTRQGDATRAQSPGTTTPASRSRPFRLAWIAPLSRRSACREITVRPEATNLNPPPRPGTWNPGDRRLSVWFPADRRRCMSTITTTRLLTAAEVARLLRVQRDTPEDPGRRASQVAPQLRAGPVRVAEDELKPLPLPAASSTGPAGRRLDSPRPPRTGPPPARSPRPDSQTVLVHLRGTSLTSPGEILEPPTIDPA
jgi:hypothetical protein